ncbi:OsmC family protein [Arthrobacter rhombi]|uniref:OsmC family protein n=1 Tax=Micrococcaceae TaxID=1268 RepID=UPI000BB68C4B|nr:OsmC family protein [Glutamicibacter sp. BW78]PCC24297.1 osmotically inducible protein OsmC [Glutamicibacter sp. BW78]
MTQTLAETSISNRAERLDSAGSAWAERIGQNTASASLQFRATADPVGSVGSTIRAGRHEFTVDEPAALAGDDVAASPVEYALGALISCQVVVYRLYAHQLGISIDSLDISADADLDVRGLFGIEEQVRPGFGDVRLTVEVSGPDAEERYAELQAAVDAHCPVLDIFTNPTPVTTTLRVNS